MLHNLLKANKMKTENIFSHQTIPWTNPNTTYHPTAAVESPAPVAAVRQPQPRAVSHPTSLPSHSRHGTYAKTPKPVFGQKKITITQITHY